MSALAFKHLKDGLDEVDTLAEVEDSENEPYKSRYAARKVLESLKKKLNDHLDSSSSTVHLPDDESETDPGVDLLGVDRIQLEFPDAQFPTEKQKLELFLLYIESRLGANYIECEETSSGEEHITNALAALENRFTTSASHTILLQITLLNQLGILYATRRQNEKAATVLRRSDNCYEQYKHNTSIAPFSPTDLLAAQSSGCFTENDDQMKWDNFEAEHVQTLYYLAQVYQKLEDSDKSAHYCQLTLKRQLELNKYIPESWALNAATLSQYYVTQSDFRLARHCLASSMKIFDEVGPVEFSEEEGSLYNKSVDIKRCWVKYALSLLEESWQRLSSEEGSVQSDDFKDESLFDLELTLYESWMTDKYVLDFEQARQVFLKAQNFLNEAKRFYTIDSFCSDYIEVLQDYSCLYKHLTKFEMDASRRSKMHKRRADMLEELVKELNPQFYLLVYRQIVYELAEVYSTMLDCKEELPLPTDIQRRANIVKKHNSLCDKSIKNYLLYVSSLKTTDGVLPDPLPEGDERPTLVAWLCIARLYKKMIVDSDRDRLNCTKQQLHYYNLIVDLCNKQEHYAKLMSAELNLCREMVALLPQKIKMLTNQQNF